MASRSLAIVIYSPFPRASGGRETWLANVLPALAGEGYRTTVYTHASTGPLVHDLSSVPNLRIRPIRGTGTGPNAVRKLLLNVPVAADIAMFVRRTTRAILNDGLAGSVVLGLGPIIDVEPGIRVRRHAPETRVACIVHGLVARELGHTLPWARPILGRREESSLRACDLVMSNGEDTRARLHAYGIDSVVIPNGIDVAAFSRPPASLPDELARARARGEAVLIMIATLRDIKGIRPFIASLPRLRHLHGAAFRAVFVGKGDAERYRRLAQAAGAADYVTFVGEQADVRPWLHGADVSVNLSGGTGMAISAIEALAAGVPVVAWDTDIYRQIIDPEQNGLLVTEGDTDALAAAFARLLSDAALRARLAEAGRESAARFDRGETNARLLAALDPLYQR